VYRPCASGGRCAAGGRWHYQIIVVELLSFFVRCAASVALSASVASLPVSAQHSLEAEEEGECWECTECRGHWQEREGDGEEGGEGGGEEEGEGAEREREDTGRTMEGAAGEEDSCDGKEEYIHDCIRF